MISFIALLGNGKDFFDGNLEKSCDFQSEQNGRCVIPLLDSNDGLPADADACGEFLLCNAGLRPKHLYFICNIFNHGDTTEYPSQNAASTALYIFGFPFRTKSMSTMRNAKSVADMSGKVM